MRPRSRRPAPPTGCWRPPAPSATSAGRATSRRCRTGSATIRWGSCGAWRGSVALAFGPKDSIRDVLPEDATEPFLLAIDRLLKALARHELERG
jgi:hypothetical protein